MNYQFRLLSRLLPNLKLITLIRYLSIFFKYLVIFLNILWYSSTFICDENFTHFHMHAHTNICISKCDDDDDKRSEFVCANNAIFGFGKCFMPTTHSNAFCVVHMPRLFFPIKTSHFRFYFYTISPWKNIYKFLASSLSSYSVCNATWSWPKRNIDTRESERTKTMKVEVMVVLVNKKWTNIYCRVLSGWGFFAIFMRIYMMFLARSIPSMCVILCIHIYCKRWGNVSSAFYRLLLLILHRRRSRCRRYIQFQNILFLLHKRRTPLNTCENRGW